MYPEIRVLVVDNEQGEATRLVEFLHTESYEVASTTSPNTALEMMKKQKYHIILAAVEMPGMDGIEFLIKVKQYDALTQVIMMSHNSTMDKIMRCLESGANDYLVKPLNDLSKVAEIIKISEDKLKRWWDNMRDNLA